MSTRINKKASHGGEAVWPGRCRSDQDADQTTRAQLKKNSNQFDEGNGGRIAPAHANFEHSSVSTLALGHTRCNFIE